MLSFIDNSCYQQEDLSASITEWNTSIASSQSSLKDILSSIGPDQPFVLHLEDMQTWATPLLFQRKQGSELVDAQDYFYYFLIYLSWELKSLLDHNPRFKAIISATATFFDTHLRIASDVSN